MAHQWVTSGRFKDLRSNPSGLLKMKISDLKLEDGGIRVRLGKTKADQRAERRLVFVEEVKSSVCPVGLTRKLPRRRKADGLATWIC